jgi:hypothetical protein
MSREILNLQDPDWNDEGRIRCEFTFKCPKVWNRLQTTADEGVRHCSECDRHVYLVLNKEEFRRHRQAGHCVAVSVKGEETFGSYVGNAIPPYDADEK